MTEQPWTWPTPSRRKNTRQRISLQSEDWPEIDRTRWAEATRPADLFDEPASASQLKPRTRKALIDGYGRWLGYLAATAPARSRRRSERRLVKSRQGGEITRRPATQKDHRFRAMPNREDGSSRAGV
jgi:hypothetical protein